MIQFSLMVFALNVLCIIYLMNSGEEYSRNFAALAKTNFTLMKIQFLAMALCYIWLMYGVIANATLIESIKEAIRYKFSRVEYFIFVGSYTAIHSIWGSHFIDLSIRAHVYKHSKEGYYSTKLTRLISQLFLHDKKTTKQ